MLLAPEQKIAIKIPVTLLYMRLSPGKIVFHKINERKQYIVIYQWNIALATTVTLDVHLWSFFGKDGWLQESNNTLDIEEIVHHLVLTHRFKDSLRHNSTQI